MHNQNFLTKKTKIVATIGPKTENEKTMEGLVKAGMNVIRLNFSHGDFEEHGARIKTVRKIAKKIGVPIAVLQDLAGPKIRIGEFYKERVILKKGSTFTLTTKNIIGNEEKAFVNYKNLPKEVKKGSTILLDDGKKKLQVLRTTPTDVVCKVIVGGETKGKRGVNVPGAYLKISSITDKDKKDLDFGIKNEVDFVALSFVRKAKDIATLREMLRKAKSDAHIIAKIETQEAIENIDEIIKEADGIMVARGDLAIEVPAQEVPLYQKMIIKKCNYAGKPVITATQMLESMIHSPVPTRAEVSDVANSILDGTDAIMLSEETTLGSYPLEAVTMMTQIAERLEGECHRNNTEIADEARDIVGAVSVSVVKTARTLKARAIIALTESGSTARMISRLKPCRPIIAMSPNDRSLAKLALSYGCFPVPIRRFAHVVEVTDEVSNFAIKNKVAKKGDTVVIAAGVPFGKTGGTNMLLAHVV